MEQTILRGIQEKKIVEVTFNAYLKGSVTRRCIPFDIGPGKRIKDGKKRYHFYDLDSPDGSHNLSILPEQLQNIRLTQQEFSPGDFVTWNNINWIVPRDWGDFS